MTIGRDRAVGGTGHRPQATVAAGVWPCPPANALNYPARYLFESPDHHGMLRLECPPGWQTVAGGPRCYAGQIAKRLTTVATGVPIRAITRSRAGYLDVHQFVLARDAP